MNILFGFCYVLFTLIIANHIWERTRTNNILKILENNKELTAMEIAHIGQFHLFSLYPLLRKLDDLGILERTVKLCNGRMRVFYRKSK